MSVWCLIGLQAMFWACLFGTRPIQWSIDTMGWVKIMGVRFWKFPGPMYVGFNIVKINYIDYPCFLLSYKKFKLNIFSYASGKQTSDIANQVIKWTNRQIRGISSKTPAKVNKFNNWGWWYLIILYAGIIFFFKSDSYYLNEHAKLGSCGVDWTVGGAVVGLIIAGWHWINIAQREIKSGMLIWGVHVGAALLLIATGCCIAMHWGQIQDMKALPFQEVNLRQSLRYSYSKGSYTFYIQEPILNRTVSYNIRTDIEYWKNGGGIEVHQIQNELGVRILYVRSLDALSK